METKMMVALICVCLAAMVVLPSDARIGELKDTFECEGKRVHLDCFRFTMLQIDSANYGRTNKDRCRGPDEKLNNRTDCISTTAKTIIERKCNGKRYCSILASSSELGGDPCPSVPKYVDVIYHCVVDKGKVAVTRGPLYTAKLDLRTTSMSNMQPSTEPTTPPPTTTPTPAALPTFQKGQNPNTTIEELKTMKENDDQGFFGSLLILLVLAKDKPRHSFLSVMAGIAAGTVIILMTVILCLCLDYRRKKSEGARFGDSDDKKGDEEELQELNHIDGKTGRNSDSARSDDHVDSAFGDDEPRECNDYEVANDDTVYLHPSLDACDGDQSLPRPPLPTKNRDGGSQRMSRRAHNDGSKGRNYDYNSNNESSFSTFS